MISVFIILFILLFIFGKSYNNKNKIISKTSYNNLKHNELIRNLQEETDDDIDEIVYNINITDYMFNSMAMYIYLNSQPQLPNNVTFLAELNISKYNNTLGNYVNKKVEVKAFEFSVNKSIYYAFVQDLTLNDTNRNITLEILNLTVDSSIFDDNYYFNVMNFKREYTILPEFSDEETEPQNDTTDTTPDSTDNSNSNSNAGATSVRSKSSGGISTGAIIGIIAGAVALIGIIVAAILIYKKLKNKNPDFDAVSFSTITDRTNGSLKTDPGQKSKNFVFRTTNQLNKEISISEGKTLKDLRKKYFKEIDLTKLRNDHAIIFLISGRVVPNKSNILVKDYFKKNDAKIITVVDTDDFILKEAKKNNYKNFDETKNNPPKQE